jgi:hypothetical protein
MMSGHDVSRPSGRPRRRTSARTTASLLSVSSGENERERAVAHPPPELRESWTLTAKLIHVAPAELLEATRIVSEPCPQFGARRELRIPFVQRCSLA